MQDVLLAVVRDRLWAASGRVGVAVGVVSVPDVWRSVHFLASVVRLAARVVAESLVSAPLTAIGMGTAKRDHPTAVLATGCTFARCHEPVHLQVHGAQEGVVRPGNVHLVRDARPLIWAHVQPDLLATVFVDHLFGCAQDAPQTDGIQMRRVGRAVRLNRASLDAYMNGEPRTSGGYSSGIAG